KLWDVATAREGARIPTTSVLIGGLAFSHDGRTLSVSEWSGAGGVTSGRVTLWGITPGPAPAATALLSIPSKLFAVSPDHRLLATASRSGEVTIRDFSTGRAI